MLPELIQSRIDLLVEQYTIKWISNNKEYIPAEMNINHLQNSILYLKKHNYTINNSPLYSALINELKWRIKNRIEIR